MPFTGSYGELLEPSKKSILEQLRTKALVLTQNASALGSQSLGIFEALNGQYLPTATQANLKKLQQHQALVVITGQQPCLWGGPALVLHKIATTVSITKWLNSEGIPAVPVFWNASEDHDLHEMFQVDGFYPDGGVQSHRKKMQALCSAEALAAEPKEFFPKGFSPWMTELWGQNQNSWAGQLSHVLMQMFAADGLIAIEPRHLAPDSIEFWTKVEQQQAELLTAYEHDEASIITSGQSLQAPRRHPLPIFALNTSGERRSLAQMGKSIFKMSENWTSDCRPSPGALLRPLFAQSQLPILASVLGPAEMKYHRQIASSYPVLGLPQPMLWPRLKGCYVPSALRSELLKQGLQPEQMLQHPEFLREILMAKSNSLEAQLLSGHLAALIQENSQQFPAAQFELRRFEQDLFKAFNRFERSLQKREFQKQGLSAQRVQQIDAWFFPRGQPQERRLGWSFILKNAEHFQHIQQQFSDPFNFSTRIYE